ncbi:MAG: ribonuclease III [Defluviitaleaceae bacterium]|nr:ribonuclease III [Defluviitaleaceae bacterium]
MEKSVNPSTSVAALAYLGDAVFELRVREMLLNKYESNATPNALNRQARKYVSATAQSAMYHAIFPLLTEEEQAIMKRGRNLHTSSRAKNADATDYRHATGLETLFGYLHERGERGRIDELFNLCISVKI